jgi:CO/xanthine dehydrogenase Mo-binding subunit
MEPPASKPRRWFQFSLRTLLVIMLVVAAFFGGRESMRPTIRAERQQAAMARAEAEMARAQAEAHQAQAIMQANQAVASELAARQAELRVRTLLESGSRKTQAGELPSREPQAATTVD